MYLKKTQINHPKSKFAMNQKQLIKEDFDIVVSDRDAPELTDHWQ